LATLISGAWLGAVGSSPSIGADTLCLLPLQVACTVTSTDSSITVFGTLLVARKAFESSFTCALCTLGSLLSQVFVLDITASVSGAEVSSALVAAWALEFTDIAQEALVAVAHWLELVVYCALATARAQVLVLVTRTQQVAFAAKESRHALALSTAIFNNGTVTLTTADSEHSALAIASWALECALVTKEARIAGAILWLCWTTTASHEQTWLQEEGRVGSKLSLASGVLVR